MRNRAVLFLLLTAFVCASAGAEERFRRVRASVVTLVEPTGVPVASTQYRSNGLATAVIDLDQDRPARYVRNFKPHVPAGYLPEYQPTQIPEERNDIKETILRQRRPELYQVLALEKPKPGMEPQGTIHLSLRNRVEAAPGSGSFQTLQQRAAWEAKKTAVIVCDMWAKHWCAGARRRGAEMAPRINQLLAEARKRGVLVIHAPSGAMDLYKDHPARKRAQAAPKAANLPNGIADWCRQIEAEKKGKYPIDQSDEGCDDQPRCDVSNKMDLHQTPVLEIRDEDALSDSGIEIWSLMEQRGIANVMLLGVHTNMCVLGRPFGLRNMARFGKNVVLVRDLTDTMYNPRAWPHVSHFRGTELIVEHIEKYVCPTITSDQLLGGKPFRFTGDAADRLARFTGVVGDGMSTGSNGLERIPTGSFWLRGGCVRTQCGLVVRECVGNHVEAGATDGF